MATLFAGLVGATSFGYGWASTLYSYNRDAFMNDIQMKQTRRYQIDTISIAKHTMYREDIRDLAEATVSRLNNYVLVSTLVLSLTAALLTNGQFPADCAKFVMNAYILCLASSFFNLILSILLAMRAADLASKCSSSLLTQKVRPDWEAYVRRMRSWKLEENTRAFDKQGAKMFIPPLVGAYHRHKSTTSANVSSQQSEPQAACRSDSGTFIVTAPHEACSSDSATGSFTVADDNSKMQDKARDEPNEDNLQIDWLTEHWEPYERKWRGFEEYAFRMAIFGTKNLLEAYGYLCMGSLYGSHGRAWAFWAVQIVFVCLNVIVAMCTFHSLNPRIVVTLATGGPMMCAIAATTPNSWIDRICVPGCFLCHFLWAIVLLVYHNSREDLINSEDAVLDDCVDSPKASLESEKQGNRPAWLDGSAPGQAEKEASAGVVDAISTVGREELSNIIEEVFQVTPRPVDSARECYSARQSLYTPRFEAARGFLGNAMCSIVCLYDNEHYRHLSISRPGVDRTALGKRQTPTPRTSIPFQADLLKVVAVGGGIDFDGDGQIDGIDYDGDGKVDEQIKKSLTRDDDGDGKADEEVTVEEKIANFKDALENLRIARGMMCSGGLVLILLWFMAFSWAIHGSYYGMNFHNAEAPWQQEHLDQALPLMKLEDNSAVEVRWPSPYFRPQSIACAKGYIFMADNYRVFEMTMSSGTFSWTPTVGSSEATHRPVPRHCAVSSIILDVATACDEQGCRPLVLLKSHPTSVFDCVSGRVWPLLQPEGPAQRIAAHGSDSLLVSHSRRVLTYRWSALRGGWQPLWPVVTLGSSHSVISLHVERDVLVVVFAAGGSVFYEARSLVNGDVLGGQQLPPRVVGSCALDGKNSSEITLMILQGEKFSVDRTKPRRHCVPWPSPQLAHLTLPHAHLPSEAVTVTRS